MQTVGEYDINAARPYIDSYADLLGEGDQQFSRAGCDLEQWRAGHAFPGEIDVAYGSKLSPVPLGRGGGLRLLRWNLEDATADEIGHEVLPGRKYDALFDGEKDMQGAKFLGI